MTPLRPGPLTALTGFLALTVACGRAGSPAAETTSTLPPPSIHILSVADAAPAADPAAEIWSHAAAFEVSLVPQVMAMPKQTQITVTAVQVQAIADGSQIAFRLRWTDRTKDESYEQDLFSDACAVQFPLDDGAAFMMGHQGARVHILHWKALWQRDVDRGFQDVQDLHPNFWMDHYWFAKGGWPHAIPAAFEDPRSHVWFPARQAGNPMSIWDRVEPVQELLAEGYGTLTAHESSAAASKGIWSDGVWTVVIRRPLKTEDPLDSSFSEARGLVAFAVWDGSADNVGARKHHSSWIFFGGLQP
jgi:hypothetical protein